MRSKSVIRRLEAQLAEERSRVEQLLQTVLMQAAPTETGVYLNPLPERDPFPATAVVSDDGQSYIDPDSGEVFWLS